MERRMIGTSGIEATAIGIGTWAAGGDTGWGSNVDDEASVSAIKLALNNGINLIDTAPRYGWGHSEELVGRAIKGFKREDLVVSTKCGLWWKDRQGTYLNTINGVELYRNLSRRTLMIEVEDSLRRLNTDYIDVYMTHWQSAPPFFTPIEETMGALLDMQKSAKIKAIGVSNVTCDILREYLKYGRVDLVQQHYSPLDRSVETELLPLCVENNITLQCYSPLEQGLLSGKFGMDYVVEPGTFRSGVSWFKPENRANVLTMLEGWKPLREKYNCSLSVLALCWLKDQSPLISVLSGGRKPEHVRQNMKALEINLTKDELAKMRSDVEALKPLK